MGEGNGFGDFFDGWFATLGKGLDQLDVNACQRLFSECAKTCAGYVVSNMYREIYDECEGDLDRFFSHIQRIDNVEGNVIEPGKVYELIFRKCECPVHTEAKISSPRLCACSKESMICVFKTLVPDRKFRLEQTSTILGGSNVCRHIITFD